MFETLLNFLKTTTGRIVAVVLLAMLAAYAVRVVLVDMPAMEAKEAMGSGRDMLESMADHLAEAIDDGTAPKTLPTLTQWYPADIPCAADAPMPPTRDKIWDIMGLPTDGGPTQFQYRFQQRDGVFELRARRDSDCDGHYAVWLLEQRGSGVLGRKITAQNIHE